MSSVEAKGVTKIFSQGTDQAVVDPCNTIWTNLKK